MLVLMIELLFCEVHGAIKLVHHLLSLFLDFFIVFLFDFLALFLSFYLGEIFEDI